MRICSNDGCVVMVIKDSPTPVVLQPCPGCETAAYCSDKCREKAAPAHADECARLAAVPKDARPVCGLCGNMRPPFTTTPCCGRTICDDDDGSFMANGYSCVGNHAENSACGRHHKSRHPVGTRWQDCEQCIARHGGRGGVAWFKATCNPPECFINYSFPEDELGLPMPQNGPSCHYCGTSLFHVPHVTNAAGRACCSAAACNERSRSDPDVAAAAGRIPLAAVPGCTPQ